jgi:hemerythrin-like domain-containing protein
MDIIEKLIAGHRDIKEKETILQKLIKMIDTDVFFWDNAGKVAYFFDTEVKRHLALEEQVLFPVLVSILPPEQASAIRALEAEHQAIKEKIEAFAAIARAHTQTPTKTTREEIVRASSDILEGVVPHAAREDALVFSLVKQYFTAKEYRQMEERYFSFLKV